MKPFMYGVAVLGFGAALAGWWSQTSPRALAQPAEVKKEQRTIQSNGQASIRVKPDSTRLFFSITTKATKIKEARDDNDTIMIRARKAFDALAIANLKMKTVDVTVQIIEDREHKLLTVPVVLGYSVVHQFTVLLENDDAVKLTTTAQKVLDTAMDSGVNGFSHIQIFKKDVEATRQQALTQAVQDAITKARALGKGIPIDALEVINVQESYNPWRGNDSMMQNSFQAGRGSDSPMTFGDLEINANVTITCKY